MCGSIDFQNVLVRTHRRVGSNAYLLIALNTYDLAGGMWEGASSREQTSGMTKEELY
jgi:hypothetical protein